MTRRSLIAAFLLAGTAAVSADRTPAWVEERVRQWQPTAREKRWESIGWVKDIRTAERLAKQQDRPVFLFTLDGRMNVGRC
jgi:hypothetical protein